MYTLLNNIVFDIFHSVVVCVDFLGTHMTSPVLFFRKPGVTGVDAEGEVTAWLYGQKFLNLRPTQAHILSVLPLMHARYSQQKVHSQLRI
jgi:hypothetical protein